MRHRVSRAALAALLMLLAASGCRAARSDYLTYGILSVPFDGLRPHDNPSTPYEELIRRLKERAAAEARDDGADAVISTSTWGPWGRERMLIAAITPARGVFYYSEFGPYSASGPTVIMPRRAIDVCRFTIAWDRLPGGAYAPGLAWAGLAIPDVDCRPPSGEALALLGQWRRDSASASYGVEATERRAGLVATLVRESWPGSAAQPLDAARALGAVTGRDRVVRAIPLSGDQPLYAVTAAGRTFVGMTNTDEATVRRRVCLVEGLGWAQIAARGGHPRMTAARELCAGLFQGNRAPRR